MGTTAVITLLGVSGVAEVVVRAESMPSGLEEKNPVILEIEYDGSGNYVEPRPNLARIESASASGLTASVKAFYPSTDEKGTATTAKLFSRALNSSYDYSSPDDTQTLTGGVNKRATLTTTYETTGWVAVVVRACTAGGTLSGGDSQEAVLYLSNATVASSDVVLTASRG
jgi:hypothetical protein